MNTFLNILNTFNSNVPIWAVILIIFLVYMRNDIKLIRLDIKLIRKDLSNHVTDTNKKIDSLSGEMNNKIDSLKTDLNNQSDILRSDMNKRIDLLSEDLREVRQDIKELVKNRQS